jgi:hypothetical protein
MMQPQTDDGKGRRRVAVEFDGVIRGPDDGPAPGAMQALAELQALGLEGNVRATIVFTVWGLDRETAEARADAVAAALAPNEWGIARPNGGQAGLLEMGMIGGRESPVVWEYAQSVLQMDLAALPEVRRAKGHRMKSWFGQGWAEPVVSKPWALACTVLDRIKRLSGYRVGVHSSHWAWENATRRAGRRRHPWAGV